MSTSRYDGRVMFLNDNKEYKKVFFKDRDVHQIFQYGSARFNYPSNEQINSLQSIPHVWTSTDKLYNLAYDYYQDPKMWWVIAWYNKKPTESHFKVGEVIYVPKPLSEVLMMV